MDCREFLRRYSEYDDSLIPAHEADRFRSHMEECASCARYDRVLRKGRMVARQLPRPEPSPDFIPRLLLRLRQRRTRLSLSTRLATGLAAVTILMVAASAVRVIDGGSGEAGSRAGAEVAAERTDPAVPGGARAAKPAVPSLPPVQRVSPRGWSETEVATAVDASYSPLETGLPAYRRPIPSSSGTMDPDRRALD